MAFLIKTESCIAFITACLCFTIREEEINSVNGTEKTFSYFTLFFGMIMGYIFSSERYMTVVNKIKIPNKSADNGQDWENPSNPEKAEDKRDVEQLLRQKKEAERRKSNLSDSDDKPENKSK